MFDPLIANSGRLRILTALANEPAEFVSLRRGTGLTDGNLATHARRLQSAGLVSIDKTFRAGKPVTTLTLTTHGRNALKSHVQALVEAIQTRTSGSDESASTPAELISASDDWVD